jgi:hypothetical protein
VVGLRRRCETIIQKVVRRVIGDVFQGRGEIEQPTGMQGKYLVSYAFYVRMAARFVVRGCDRASRDHLLQGFTPEPNGPFIDRLRTPCRARLLDNFAHPRTTIAQEPAVRTALVCNGLHEVANANL